MVQNGIRWWASYQPHKMAYDLQAVRFTPTGERFTISTVFTQTPLDTVRTTLTGPTMSLEPDEAQNLMDALWGAGLRPRDGDGGLAHTNAQAVHLKDLRAIAFKGLGIKS